MLAMWSPTKWETWVRHTSHGMNAICKGQKFVSVNNFSYVFVFQSNLQIIGQMHFIPKHYFTLSSTRVYFVILYKIARPLFVTSRNLHVVTDRSLRDIIDKFMNNKQIIMWECRCCDSHFAFAWTRSRI